MITSLMAEMSNPKSGLKKVLVVDDHAVLRDGIKLMLANLEPDVTVYEAATAAEAFDVVQQCSDFDLVLLDLALPDDRQGLLTLDSLCEMLPTVPVVVLSADEKSTTVRETLSRGAKGYLPKSSQQNIMQQAIQLVLSGGIYLPPTILDTTGEVALNAIENLQEYSQDRVLNDRLTNRQIDIVKLIAQGRTNKEIARILNMSTATVRTHLTMIFKRLGVKNRTEAGHVVHELGLDLNQ